MSLNIIFVLLCYLLAYLYQSLELDVNLSPAANYILNLAASFIASSMLEGLAILSMQYHRLYQWSGEVLIKGSPTVTFTPMSKAIIFKGISP